MNIENLSVCEIGTLYLLQKNAKKGFLEITSLALPELLKVSRMSALKFLNGLEKEGFLKTQRTLGKNGKLKIFIANYLNFRQLEQVKSLNFRQLKSSEKSAVCIGEKGRNSYENLNLKNDSAVVKSSSFPLNNPPINYNLTNKTNKIKTTNNICAPAQIDNNNNLLFKQEKPNFPYFEGAGVLKEIVVDFFNYRKKDLKKPIKTQRGLDRLVNRLKTFSKNSPAVAKLICEQSKDHEWQDIFELKEQNNLAQTAQADKRILEERKRRAFLDTIMGDR